MTNDELLERARALRGLIEAEASATESHATMSPAVVDALDETGLFRILVPAELGGYEVDVNTLIAISEELAYADGSVGWAFVQNATVGGYLAYLDPDIAATLAPRRAGAGMFAPLGVAHEEPGGYRVSGKFSFGSGSGHAEFMGGAALVMHGDEVAAPGEDGSLPVIGFLLPSENVMIAHNWDVMGLRGTGSYDFEVPEQHVEGGATWPLLERGTAHSLTGGPIYGLGSIVLGTIGSVAFAVGVAQRALDEMAAIAMGGRNRLGQTPLVEQQIFQRDFGRHSIVVQSARGFMRAQYNTAVAAITAQAGTDEVEQRLRTTKAAATFVVEACRDVVTTTWRQSGSAGIRNSSVLQRCFRDLSVGAGHLVFDDRNYNEYAKSVLGLDPAPY